MSDERNPQGNPPEYPPEVTGIRWLPIAEVKDLIGKKERNARYWLDRHAIPSRGDRPKLFSEEAIRAKLVELGQTHLKAPEHVPETTGILPEYPPETTGTYSEPIEAAYRVAGEATAEVALVPLATMVEELRGLADQLAELARRNEALALEVGQLRERQIGHEGQLVAKGETIATQRKALAGQSETIAELRRRVEAAEADRAWRHEEEARAAELLRRRNEQEWLNRERMQVAEDGPGAAEPLTPDDPSGAPSQGFWTRVRRVFGGE